MKFLKIPFLLGSAVAIHQAATPPNPRPGAEQENPDLYDILILVLPFLAKTLNWLLVLTETALILSSTYPDSSLSRNVLGLAAFSKIPDGIDLTATFLFGWLLMVVGTYFRVASYRELGRFFTFEVRILSGHRLVTTGPYAIVRHPSYSGAVGIGVGFLMCHFTPGSLLWQFMGVLLRPSIVLASPFIVVILYIVANARIRTEEELLRKEFGKEWEDWTRRVRWKLIPGLY